MLSTTAPSIYEEPIHVKQVEETPKEACNCVTYVRNRVDNLPRMVDIFPNTEAQVGAVAVEWFGDVKHVSIVTAVEPDGVWVKESNFDRCKYGKRFIPFDKYSLYGFWIHNA